MKRQSEQTTNNQKKTYISPELKVYGTISELTHSGIGGQVDGFSGTAFGFNETLPPVK